MEAEPSDDLAADLQQYVKDPLAKYEYPRDIKFLDDLPRTLTGKI
jgi:acetyl-CoA synthetase